MFWNFRLHFLPTGQPCWGFLVFPQARHSCACTAPSNMPWNFSTWCPLHSCSVKNAIVWDVTPCNLVEIHHILGEPATLNVQLAGSFETMNFYLATPSHIPESSFCQSRSHDSIRSCIPQFISVQCVHKVPVWIVECVQGDSGVKVSILSGGSISHCETESLYGHVQLWLATEMERLEYANLTALWTIIKKREITDW